mmetsp:Transcript_90745/g.277831  ORF Transcript_90745/g.277831 Transcript_90745/m.277831 type:complete len:205 (+) Transcript_90745:224-838(+)
MQACEGQGQGQGQGGSRAEGQGQGQGQQGTRRRLQGLRLRGGRRHRPAAVDAHGDRPECGGALRVRSDPCHGAIEGRCCGSIAHQQQVQGEVVRLHPGRQGDRKGRRVPDRVPPRPRARWGAAEAWADAEGSARHQRRHREEHRRGLCEVLPRRRRGLDREPGELGRPGDGRALGEGEEARRQDCGYHDPGRSPREQVRVREGG